MISSREECCADPPPGFYQMNNISVSQELLAVENQTNNNQSVNINCCTNVQCWRNNVNSNNKTTEDGETKSSCLDKLKKIHVSLKILAVLIGIFITVSPFFPKIIAQINVSFFLMF